METNDLLTARDAARELGVHIGTVHGAFQENRLPFVALYGRKLITRAALEAYKKRTRPDGEKPKGRPRKGRSIQASNARLEEGRAVAEQEANE